MRIGEWLFGGRSSSSRRARDDTDVDRHRHRRPSLRGCMSTLFQLFDFHSPPPFTHYVYNNHNSSSFHHSPNFLKASHHGVEAPRNNLELDEASINSCLRNKNENYLQIQMGLEMKRRKNGGKKWKASEQKQYPNIDDHNNIASNSPNLLARLMGLDNLPQTSSPSRPRQPKSDACYHVSGTCSLPESPRVLSSRLSDVDSLDDRHRPSLEISSNKKNKKKVVALVDITNNNKKLEYGKHKQDVSKVKNQKPISMSVSRPRPKPKAREEDEASNYNLLNNLNHPTKFSVKKLESSSFVAEVPHDQQPNCSDRKGKQKAAAVDGGERNAVDKIAAADGGAAELKYIRNSRHISSPDYSWFSICHVRRRSSSSMKMRGWELTRAKCEVLEDTDLGKWNMLETEGIVRVVQFHILDSLLRETIAAIVSVHKRRRFIPN